MTLIIMSLVENVEAPAPRVGGFLIMCNYTELKAFHRLSHNYTKVPFVWLNEKR